MLLPLKNLKSSNRIIKFFVAGIIGCLLEYVVSLYGDYVMHVKWWDYSKYFLNINGRTCLLFGIFWGILGIWLVDYLNLLVDRFIDDAKNRIPVRRQSIIIVMTNVFLLIDFVVSSIALDCFQTRAVVERKIALPNDLNAYYSRHYEDIYSHKYLKSFITTAWSDELMIKTLPNVKITIANGKNVYLSSYYPEIKDYYFKVFDIDRYEKMRPNRIIGGFDE